MKSVEERGKRQGGRGKGTVSIGVVCARSSVEGREERRGVHNIQIEKSEETRECTDRRDQGRDGKMKGRGETRVRMGRE